MKHIVFFLAIFCLVIPTQAQYEKKVRVITYNTLASFENDSARTELGAAFIADCFPDVVALQELCGGYSESNLKKLAEKWGHSYSVLLKDKGCSVGLTSNMPIVVKNKMIDGFWHGVLHVATHDIDFLVLHLSPADLGIRQQEADSLLSYMHKQLKGIANYMVLGDFNSHSPFDAYLYEGKEMLLAKYRRYDETNKDNYHNLFQGQLDYSVISKFLAYPLVDVCERKVPGEERFTFPSSILIGNWRKAYEVVPTRERIDFIFASPRLAEKCVSAQVLNTGISDQLSDHFPVVADFHYLD